VTGPWPGLLQAAAALAALSSAAAACADERWSWALDVHQLEWQESADGDAAAWDVTGRIGTDHNRVWLRYEGGRHIDGAARDNRLELLWGHPVKHWEWLVGVRQDEGTTPSRTYFALGIQAQGPFGIWLESTGYLGDGSRNGDDIHVGYRLMAEREWELSRRFALGLRAEYELWSEDHVRYSEGHGPSGVFAGLRLHYTPTARVAPYVGVEWFRLLGDTADLARRFDESDGEARFLAGLRLQFGQP
jgi:copper resistance protein B